MEFYKETNFKETPIGKIPREWDIVKLEAVASVSAGGNAPQGEKYFRNGKYPFIRVQHFDGNKIYVDKWDLINDEAVKDYNLKLFPKNSIVFPKSGAAINLEKRAMLPFDSYVVNHLCVLVAKSEIIDSKFLFYIMKKTNLSRSSAGTTLPYLNLKTISKIPLPLPSLVEQRGIVEVLSVVDLAIQKTDEIIAKTERLKRGLMQTLLTKGIGHKEFKETPIGKIPKDWEIIKLGSIVEFRNGKRPETILRKGIPIYGANGIMGYTDKFLIDEKFTVIIARVGMGTVGKVHLAKGKIWVSDNAIYTRCKLSEVYPPYLFYFLKFMHLGKLALRSAAGSYAIITQDSLKNLKLRLPPLIEQQRIAKILMNIDKKLELEIKEKTKLVKIKQNLMDLLLTGKVRVKVN